MRLFVFILFTALVVSCGRTRNHGGEYGTKVLSWMSTKTLEKSSISLSKDKFYLYFNDEATCDTCKLQIINSIKDRQNVAILTSFENPEEVELFKEGYKITNEVINKADFQSKELRHPFIFQSDSGKIYYNIFILEGESMDKNHVQEYFDYVAENRVVFF